MARNYRAVLVGLAVVVAAIAFLISGGGVAEASSYPEWTANHCLVTDWGGWTCLPGGDIATTVTEPGPTTLEVIVTVSPPGRSVVVWIGSESRVVTVSTAVTGPLDTGDTVVRLVTLDGANLSVELLAGTVATSTAAASPTGTITPPAATATPTVTATPRSTLAASSFTPTVPTSTGTSTPVATSTATAVPGSVAVDCGPADFRVLNCNLAPHGYPFIPPSNWDEGGIDYYGSWSTSSARPSGDGSGGYSYDATTLMFGAVSRSSPASNWYVFARQNVYFPTAGTAYMTVTAALMPNGVTGATFNVGFDEAGLPWIVGDLQNCTNSTCNLGHVSAGTHVLTIECQAGSTAEVWASANWRFMPFFVDDAPWTPAPSATSTAVPGATSTAGAGMTATAIAGMTSTPVPVATPGCNQYDANGVFRGCDPPPEAASNCSWNILCYLPPYLEPQCLDCDIAPAADALGTAIPVPTAGLLGTLWTSVGTAPITCTTLVSMTYLLPSATQIRGSPANWGKHYIELKPCSVPGSSEYLPVARAAAYVMTYLAFLFWLMKFVQRMFSDVNPIQVPVEPGPRGGPRLEDKDWPY